MAITVADFKAEFPEFDSAPDDLVNRMIDRAIELVPPEVWDGAGLTEQGTFLYTAQFLALSPFGRNIGMVAKDGTTTYDNRLDLCRGIVSSGFRVI